MVESAFVNGQGYFMKAVICSSYGSPDNLKLEEVEEPTADDNQAIVEVYAA